MSLPNRSSDAGPDSRKYCPKCGSDDWSTIRDCMYCGDTVCDCCPGIRESSPTALVCAACASENENVLGLEKGIPVLQPITATVRLPHIPEWEGK